MAAVGNAMDNGAELKCGFEVTRIEKTVDGYKVWSGDRFVEGKVVINCAGVYSDDVAAMAGDTSFSVHARRGEYMLLDRECGDLISHTVFRCPSKMGKGILVTPTVDGNLLLGPTAEDIEDKEDTKTTQAGLDTIRAKATEQVSGVNLGKVITSFTGLRSVGSTGDFIINEKDGFINVAGIESPGLTSSPAIGEYVVDMIRNMGVTLTEKESYNPNRRPMHYFKELDVEGKNAVIKEHPEFAHVICRCETVSEGEILEAIRTNPKPSDIDGVKRRTRATMGRCQGGFCSPYIVELLAREMGVDYCDVTKCGGESYINVSRTKNKA
jgi:glycerol-3-phosphate dehydrogenase